MISGVLLLAVAFLAYANGANDNFKGVASLFGSRTVSYRSALTLATVSTFAGSLCALVLASALLTTFSGRGLVPDEFVASRYFLTAVAAGAGGTVMLATVMGLPISTTHALTGALVGTGLLAAGSQMDLGVLQRQFILPLLLGPVTGCVLSIATFHSLRAFHGRNENADAACLCVGTVESLVALPECGGTVRAHSFPAIAVTVDSESRCSERYAERFLALDTRRLTDAAHVFSAGLVSFARGLNDAPKIAALLIGVAALNASISIASVACAMAIGGVLSARRVAETMSHGITTINHSEGLAANAATSLLVIAASVFGLPVSTTHVSVGAITGIGILTRQANMHVISGIVGAWLVTLPCAAALSATAYWALS